LVPATAIATRDAVLCPSSRLADFSTLAVRRIGVVGHRTKGAELDRKIFRFEDVVWDVTGLQMEILRAPRRFGPLDMPIDDALMHSISLYKEPDEQLIAGMDVSRRDTPILVVVQETGRGRVVDGNHRLLRRHRDGCDTVKCFVVPWEVACRHVRPAD
jgi:hypothetical protein